ncbi:hypothetical protein SDC9_09197 [bioreactor metagenome]|uniref:Uncharacterized protein n=1 Tax=bioreactor metagenome TaxID=1076179 RepID=A0A644TAP9_9ZZZZ
MSFLAIPSAVSWAQDSSCDKHVTQQVYNSAGDIVGTTRGAAVTLDVKLPANTYVLDVKSADVTGDAVRDDIFLLGQKEKTAIYASNIHILIKNGATNHQDTVKFDRFGGYEAKLFVGDFTGDKVNDIMITAPTGGSGGITGHMIVRANGAEPTVLFNDKTENNGVKFTGQFTDGFKAVLRNANTGQETSIDLGAKKDIYVDYQIYTADGRLLKQIKPYSYPFTVLEPVDYNCDGTYELQGVQRIVGAYGADGIANVTSLWQYQVDKWVVKKIELTTLLYNDDMR